MAYGFSNDTVAATISWTEQAFVFFSVQSPTFIYTVTSAHALFHRAQNWMFQQDGDQHPSITIEVRLVNMKQKCICLCLSNATTHFQTNLDIS